MFSAVKQTVSSFPPKPFQPFFIVGNERSGTTLLAVLLDRHSRLCVPPELHYFNEIYLKNRFRRLWTSHASMVEDAFKGRVGLLNLKAEDVLSEFRKGPKTWKYLLEVVLSQYALVQGKARAGSKTPSDIFHVPRILRWYPQAKIICLMRDGRDAVHSLMTPPWTAQYLRRKCYGWRKRARMAALFAQRWPENFKIVHFESLLADPHAVLAQVDAFLGESLEERQFDTSIASGAYLPKETQIMGKAATAVDPSRAQAWRRSQPRHLRVMNAIMGPYLKYFGYELQKSPACSWPQRLWEAALNLLSGMLYEPNYFKLRYLLRGNPVSQNLPSLAAASLLLALSFLFPYPMDSSKNLFITGLISQRSAITKRSFMAKRGLALAMLPSPQVQRAPLSAPSLDFKVETPQQQSQALRPNTEVFSGMPLPNLPALPNPFNQGPVDLGIVLTFPPSANSSLIGSLQVAVAQTPKRHGVRLHTASLKNPRH